MERIIHYFYDVIAANGYLWLLEANMNALFKMDIKTFKLEFVSLFPEESAVSRLYVFAAKYENKLVCCPRSAGRIVIYDIDSDSMETINTDLNRYKMNRAQMYGGGLVGHKVYLPRQGYSEIYQMDILSGKLSKVNILGEEIELGMDDYFWHGRIRQYKSDTEILLYSLKYNAFYWHNILTSETRKIMCFEEKLKLTDFVTDGSYIWGLCCDGKIYKSDGSQIVEEHQFEAAGDSIMELLYHKDRIYIIDAMTGKVKFAIGNETGKYKDTLKKIPDNSTEIFMYSFNREDSFWLQWQDGFLYYDDGTNKVAGVFESDLDKIPAAALLPQGVIWENRRILLQRLLKVIKYLPDGSESICEKNTGVHIHSVICKG